MTTNKRNIQHATGNKKKGGTREKHKCGGDCIPARGL